MRGGGASKFEKTFWGKEGKFKSDKNFGFRFKPHLARPAKSLVTNHPTLTSHQ